MPGYATWKTLYEEEYLATREEGYDVSGIAAPHEIAVGEHDESAWEAAYAELYSARAKGVRDDYPYQEPSDLSAIYGAAADPPSTTPIESGEYRSRVEGAWFGRIAGIILGKPLEIGWGRRKIRGYLESCGAYPLDDWVPAASPEPRVTTRRDSLPSTRGNVRFAQPDDDIHYTVLALLLAEKKGRDFTVEDVASNWLDNIPYHWVWCASRQAYYRLVTAGLEGAYSCAIADITGRLNPWRECIDGQIRTDFWGYIHPGDPRGAATLAHRDCSLSLVRNGIYGGMFVSGCVAGALTRDPTVESILRSGLAVVPAESRFREMVDRVVSWYADRPDWEYVCERIEETYGHLPYAGTLNNMAVVVLSLLEGNLDHSRTITTAVMCGFDTDCNAGTAGSIVGAAVGSAGIEPRWTDPLSDDVRTVVAGFGHGRISSLVDRTVEVAQSLGTASGAKDYGAPTDSTASM